MALPASAGEIYDLLVADTAIAAALGTYKLPDNSERPSIAVLATNEQLPPGTEINGLEIIIAALPSYNAKILLTSETLLNPTWKIYIMGWQSIEDMQAVVERILLLLPNATVRQNVFTRLTEENSAQAIGIIDQFVVTWTNPCEVIL